MKRIWALSFLMILSVGLLYFVSQEKKKISSDKIPQNYVASIPSSAPALSSISSSIPTQDFKLRVLSEPEGADVFIDSQRQGSTPYEFTIGAESQKLKLIADGYDDYERQVPAAKDAEGDLVWKIQLKRLQKTMSSSSQSKAEAVKIMKSENPEKKFKKQLEHSLNSEAAKFSFTKKVLKGWLLQLKAYPLSQFTKSEVELFTRKDFLLGKFGKPQFCRVEVKGDVWVRVLIGPYSLKDIAQKNLLKIKDSYPDAFLNKNQNCIAGASELEKLYEK